MSDILRVLWTVVPRSAPQPWLNCNRCRGIRRFGSSGKIRVNANGKRLDAWLIYKCTCCDSTWNRPVLERRHVRTIDPLFLMSLRANDPELARRLAFDRENLRRKAGLVEEFDDVVVRKEMLSESIAPARRLEILCAVPETTRLRVDRLLATELHLSRSRIRNLQNTGDLAVSPEGSRRLRTAVRDGMRVTISLSEAYDHDRIAMAARSSD
jgi:hypothetical protein